MNTLTDKEGKPITLEQFNDALLKIVQDASYDAVEQYLSNLELFSKEMNISKETPALGDIAAMCAVQSNVLYMMKTVLCELFGIEDTAADGKENMQEEQNQQYTIQPE